MVEVVVELNKNALGNIAWKVKKRKHWWTPIHDVLASGSPCGLDDCDQEVSMKPIIKTEAMTWRGPGKRIPWLKTYRFCSVDHTVEWARRFAR